MKNSLILFTLVLLAFTGCAKKPAADNASTAADVKSVANVSEVAKVEPRTGKAPNFSWRDADGKTVDFASVSGKVNLINFWATWCGPCKHELPDLIALNKEYEGRGVKIIGVSADLGSDVLGDVKSFVQEQGIPYQIVIANDEMKEAFGNVNMLPTSFITDKDGNILKTIIGAQTKATFAAAIDEHLK